MYIRRVSFLLGAGLIASLILFTGARAAHARDESIRELYAGSFIAEHTDGAYYYWYVHPITKDRYGIDTLDDFSRLLRKTSVGIETKNLTKIPLAGESGTSGDPLLITRFSGRILLQVDKDGRAWYVNPLNRRRYELENNERGFETIKKLALDIRTDRLTEIPVTRELGFSEVTYTSQKLEQQGVDFDSYMLAFDLLRTGHLYKDKFTEKDLFQGSLAGLAAATKDPNTEYYPPEKHRQQQQYFSGDTSIEGIGAVITAKEKSIHIVSLIKDGPAERAGLKAKDQILAVNSVSTEGMTVEEAVSKIKGPAGTSVVLRVYRSQGGTTSEYRIVRERVEVPIVEGEILDNSVAYIKVYTFTANLTGEMWKTLRKVITPQTSGVILDLRDNLGGLTLSAAQLADFWLKENDLILTDHRPKGDTKYVASGGKEMPEVRTVVLMNEDTASSSEIVAGALRHYKQATLVGTATYGKGTGQTIATLEDSSGLKYTIFEWLLPDGSSVEGKGLTPDIIVERGGGSDDVQLDRAKQFIKYGF